MQKQKNDEDMKNLLVTLIMAVAFGLAAEAQSSAYKPNANAASEVSADDTAAIVYDTMWHSTEAMAHAIENAFLACGYKPRLYNLHYCHNSDVIADAMTAKYIAVGSPTLNNNMMPSVASFLTYFKGLNGNKKKFIAFGSYGWGGQSPDQVFEGLKSPKCEALMPAVKIAYKPSDEQLKKIEADVLEALKNQN